MLFVTSNWAIADGTLVDPPRRGRDDRFHADLRRSAVQAGFRRDGCYRPPDRIEIVLAGDTFDWLLSDAWLGDSKPWHHPRRSDSVAARVMARALRHAARPLARLSRIVRRGLPVPAADFRGRPIVGSEVRVPFRATLLSGDRDARIEEPPGLRLAARWGMEIGGRWTDGAVVVCHGHEFDPLCCGESGDASIRDVRAAAGDRPPTLHESIVVDLLAGFGAMLRDRSAGHDGGRRLMRVLAGTHPLDLPRRLASWLQRAVERDGLAGSRRDRIATLWRRAVAEWHRRARRQVPWSEATFDAVAEIAAWMDGLGGAGRAAEMPGGIRSLVEASSSSAVPPAGAARVSVFGHLSRRRSATTGGALPVRICLGPLPVRRSDGAAPLVRGAAVDVACVAPEIGGFETEPRSATVFEPGECGGSDTFVRVEDQDVAEDSQPGVGTPEGVRIVDAA